MAPADGMAGPTRLAAVLVAGERSILLALTVAMVALPLAQMGARALFDFGLVGASTLSQHLALWIGWLGAAAAAFRGRHVGVGEAIDAVGARIGRTGGRWRGAFIAAAVTAVAVWLLLAALAFVRAELASPQTIGGWLPLWAAELALPVGLAGILAAQFLGAGARPGPALIGAAIGLGAGPALAGGGFGGALPAVGVLVLAFALGAPVYVLIGGTALALFTAIDVPSAAVAVEAYRLASSPVIPAIPLFTLVGFLMTASRASDRLVELFRAFFGWVPGGVALASVLVCAFFASFTGSSGVLILALGGLLLPVLRGAGHDERFAVGLVTSAGSAGLLLPPSLALILFAVVARISIVDLFLANLELGYLTPRVGMNLYLAAYRFEKPLLEVVGAVLPVLLVMLAAVLAIAYLPLVLPFPGF